MCLLRTSSAAENLAKEKAQEKLDIANEKDLLEKQKKAKALRKLEYQRIAKEKKDKELALSNKKTKVEEEAEKPKSEKKTDDKSEVEAVVKNEIKEDKAKDKDTEKPVRKDDKLDSKDVNSVTKDDKETKDVVSAIEAEMKKASNSDKKKTDNKKEKTEEKEIISPEKEAKDTEKEKKKIADTKTDTKEAEEVVGETDKNESDKDPQSEPVEDSGQKTESGLKKSFAENVITFTLTPFDELNKQSRITLSDSGYLINVAIPWSEIYYDKDTADIQMKSGDRLGINIVVKDYDKGEKGNKELISADTSLPLPKLILKNTLFD